MNASDIFMQGVVFGLVVGLIAGIWLTLQDVFGDNLPRLRELARELAAVRALLATNRSTERARQHLLEEARRQLHRQDDA